MKEGDGRTVLVGSEKNEEGGEKVKDIQFTSKRILLKV